MEENKKNKGRVGIKEIGIDEMEENKKNKGRDEIDKNTFKNIQNRNIIRYDDFIFVTSLFGDENVEYCFPYCAPWKSLRNNKFKVRLLPGNVKKGKLIKEVVGKFLGQANEFEKGFIKKVGVEEFMEAIFFGLLKISGQSEIKSKIRIAAEQCKIATFLAETCTLTDTTERLKFEMYDPNSKSSKSIVDSKILDLKNRLENIDSKICSQYFPKIFLESSSVTDLSVALVENNESLNVYKKKITMHESRKKLQRENYMLELFGVEYIEFYMSMFNRSIRSVVMKLNNIGLEINTKKQPQMMLTQLEQGDFSNLDDEKPALRNINSKSAILEILNADEIPFAYIKSFMKVKYELERKVIKKNSMKLNLDKTVFCYIQDKNVFCGQIICESWERASMDVIKRFEIHKELASNGVQKVEENIKMCGEIFKQGFI
ncbi:DUF3441 domain-containing protein [Hamiltosporidium tvaerminnensis]|uniref:DUF3441 domain-containing protein n=1 Tax=Hamiltosporidium tvaerminnensis TaxID=1176355 RepID=A0A4Q9LTW5_9MICR|nr:DUF3441 domain-containing protein [Hamiltosporidium tvaerminnensis]